MCLAFFGIHLDGRDAGIFSLHGGFDARLGGCLPATGGRMNAMCPVTAPSKKRKAPGITATKIPEISLRVLVLGRSNPNRLKPAQLSRACCRRLGNIFPTQQFDNIVIELAALLVA